MSLSIDQKKAVVSEAVQIFSAAEAVVLAEYRGLSVAQITDCLLYTSPSPRD